MGDMADLIFMGGWDEWDDDFIGYEETYPRIRFRVSTPSEKLIAEGMIKKDPYLRKFFSFAKRNRRVK